MRGLLVVIADELVDQFVNLLNSAYLDFDVLPELLSSLPIAGKDGTLKKRMKGTSAYGRLRGKTGTIDGVSSLVGVVQSLCDSYFRLL